MSSKSTNWPGWAYTVEPPRVGWSDDGETMRDAQECENFIDAMSLCLKLRDRKVNPDPATKS